MDQLGRYRIRGEIGSGRYATVYEAQEGADHCALKVLKDEALPDSPAARTALAGSLEALTSLGHPSALRVIDAGEEEGKLFVAMELMAAPTLAQVLEEKHRLEEKKVVLYVRQAAQALDMARDVGLCHGDLNPRNVFVVSEERIKLSDFAVRRFIENPPEPNVESGEDWVSDEELLETMGVPAGQEGLEDDYVGLAGLMMSMFGLDVPERQPGQDLDAYREELMRKSYGQLSEPDSGVSVHVAEVARRLLTPGGFDSPGEVVVEMASAMLVRRTGSRSNGSPTHSVPPPAGAETIRVDVESGVAAEPAPPSVGEPEPLAFQGDPREGAFTPFFIWGDRHGGRFFVIYDGERLAIGRDPDVADMVLMDPAVSRRHCIISKEGSTIRLEDLGSTNGTFINDEKLQGGTEISPNDNVRIGATRLYMTLSSRDMG